MRITKAKEVVKFAVANNFPICLVSPPGVGKTSIVKEVASEMEYKLCISHPAVNESIDYRGMPWIHGTEKPKVTFLPFTQMEELVTTQEPTIAFFDDLGQATIPVQAALMQVIGDRRLNELKVSPYVRFVAASNRREDKAGVVGMIEPLKSRFTSLIDVEVSVDDWVEWAFNNEMPPTLIQFIKWRGLPALFDHKPTMDLKNSPNPRSVAHIGNLMKAGLPPEYRLGVFAGTCGDAWATEFLAFVDLVDKLPDIEAILKDPMSVPVPTQGDVLYATISSLLQKLNKSTFPNIAKFASRLPIEYHVSLMQDAVRQKKELLSTPTWREWLQKHAHLYL